MSIHGAASSPPPLATRLQHCPRTGHTCLPPALAQLQQSALLWVFWYQLQQAETHAGAWASVRWEGPLRVLQESLRLCQVAVSQAAVQAQETCLACMYMCGEAKAQPQRTGCLLACSDTFWGGACLRWHWLSLPVPFAVATAGLAGMHLPHFSGLVCEPAHSGTRQYLSTGSLENRVCLLDRVPALRCSGSSAASWLSAVKGLAAC